ncbi:probable receptor-like protein kinase At1g30570 [Rhodamnia argentea]|uniref:Probable receptor-like protein kinase At1g30570 n=1 Tax=Rhodamnia argentea TaxID=178133 RepID=A0ABM3H5I5_9MYRT|nr:probable receptor-like protein kinase At1g30570 [Rhodamnia argentea]
MQMGKLATLVLLYVVSFCSMVGTGEVQLKTVLINCGTNSSFDVDGRRWVGDLAANNNLTLSSAAAADTTAALSRNTSLGPLYGSARIFTGGLNYTFQGVQGDYFVRLHLCPFTFDHYNANGSEFSVAANGLELLSQYSVPGDIATKNPDLLSSESNGSSYLIKEFFLSISSNELVIEFLPSKGSFGFINGLELVVSEDDLFAGAITKVGGNIVNLNLSGRGMETMYRLNVGGSQIKPSQDPDLWRTWEVDTSYMTNVDAGSQMKNDSNITYASSNDSSAAPLLVYETARTMSNTQVLEKRFNMSWKLAVDPGFEYLVRLHFCELLFGQPNQRNFRIYVNNRTAADNFDIYARAGGKNKAYHQDYLDAVSSNTLWIQLGPDTATGASGTDALLNGLEIYKLSRNGNLAYVGTFNSAENKTNNPKARVLLVGIGAGIGSVLILALVATVIFLLRKRRRSEIGSKNNAPGWRPLFLHGAILNTTTNAKEAAGTKKQNGSVASMRMGKRFTVAEIRAATKNFDEKMVIGVGGFGKVYRGKIEDGTLAAIKRAHPQSQQGLTEFETEIEMLSKLRHRHLVSMIGFCEEQNEMILVYEYMANGTLRSHLFGSALPPLSWRQRLEVCIGAARGLHYLHTGADRGIIHRDVKTTNILLDEKFVAKMSDFGLSKIGPALEHTHVSTAVKGSFGYLDPEYFRRQQLTQKSDVYSFGVVLFEVICARAVINPSLPKDQINLAEWALRWQRQRSLDTIIDPRLIGQYSSESMKKFGEIAEKCLADEGRSRPTMGEVLWHLEYVLQIHEAWSRANDKESSSLTVESLKDCQAGGAEERQNPLFTDPDLAISMRQRGKR